MTQFDVRRLSSVGSKLPLPTFPKEGGGYDVFQVGSQFQAGGGPTVPGGGTSEEPVVEEIDPSRKYWYPITLETAQMLEPEGDYPFAELPSRAQKEIPLANYARIMRGTIARRWIVIGSPDQPDEVFIWASMDQLESIAGKLMDLMEAEESPPMYEEPKKTNWLLIGGAAVGAVALIGIAVVALRK
jgi:hypothetical protein